MAVRELTKDIYLVGAIDWDRRLFDELVPIPNGTTYNSYLIKGSEKTAIIDTVDPNKKEEFISNLKKVGVEKIDYIIANHAEQDHSGAIPDLLSLYPDSMVVTNEKCKEMLQNLLLIDDSRFIVVSGNQKLSLGNKTLQFIITPWVHWPETMVTYELPDAILFSCDFFGSHIAISETFVSDDADALRGAKRYYAEIMMPFRSFITKHLSTLSPLEIKTIAPSHGPIYTNPSFIIDSYKEWVSDTVKNEVVLPHISMHGSTAKMVECFVDTLIELGISVKPFNLSGVDIGELAIATVDAATIVLASPTVLMNAHPGALYAATLVNIIKPKTKFFAIIGSYGWGGKMVEQLNNSLSNMNVEVLPPVLTRGYPTIESFNELKKLGQMIYNKHKSIGIIS